MRPASPPLKLRMARWHSATVLEGFAREDVGLSNEEITDRKEFLWNAMLTEYDAKNLAEYLATRGIEFSREFL